MLKELYFLLLIVVCVVAKITVLCCRSFSSYSLLLCAWLLRLLYNAEGALALTPYCCVLCC